RRGEYVGGRPLIELGGELLGAGQVELNRDAGMGPLELARDLPEGVSERGRREDAKRGRVIGRRADRGRDPQQDRDRPDGSNSRGRGPHDSASPFPIMTSVDLITAKTISPNLSPIRSADDRVITETSS